MACEVVSGSGYFVDGRKRLHAEFQEAIIPKTREIESKAITPNGIDDFQNILITLHQNNLVCGSDWSKVLYSFYYDTPEMDIHNSGKCLRIRAEEVFVDTIRDTLMEMHRDNDSSKNTTLATKLQEAFEEKIGQRILPVFVKPDISSKGKTEQFGRGGTVRRELEKSLGKDIQLDLNPLFEEYKDSPEDLAFLQDLCTQIDCSLKDIREHFYIRCRRANFKIALYFVDQEDGTTVVKFHSGLNGDADKARKAIFEFSLDYSKFYATDPNTGKEILLGKDEEIEFEFQREPCSYDRDNGAYKSDPNITEEDVKAGINFIRDEIVEKSVINSSALDWTGTSKQCRGFNALEKYEQEHGKIGLPGTATRKGAPIPVLPVDKGYLVPDNHASNTLERKIA